MNDTPEKIAAERVLGISIDELRDDIEAQYQELCKEAKLGGAATLDELANVAGNMSLMMEVVDDLAGAIIKLRDEVAAWKK